MKKALVYGISMLALSAAPVLAQSGQNTPQPRTGGTPQGTTQPRQGTTRGTTGSQSGTSADSHFVMDAARGGMAEVEFGKLAVDKASNDQVKQFGQRMVDDHGKANDELKSIAQQKNVTLPTELDAKHKATRDRLAKLSGPAFDRAYMQEMLTDHRTDVNDFRKESQSGKDPDVKAFAAKTLPTLEEHLKMAQTTNGAVGTSGTKYSNPTKGTSNPNPNPGANDRGGPKGSSGSSGSDSARPNPGDASSPGTSNNPR